MIEIRFYELTQPLATSEGIMFEYKIFRKYTKQKRMTDLLDDKKMINSFSISTLKFEMILNNLQDIQYKS